MFWTVCLFLAVVFVGYWFVKQGTESAGTGRTSHRSSERVAGLKNVILITLDTTRGDRLGCYGYEGAKTPVMDELSLRGVTFEAAYAPTPITLPSHASLLTGAYPPHHGVRNNGRYELADEHTTLAELFKKAGWRTGAFVSAYVLSTRFGLGQGFEVYDDDLWDGKIPESAREIRNRIAEQTTQRALRWIDSIGREKFFAWIHFFDPHQPYSPPSPFKEEFASSLYDGEIAYMDKVIGDLLRQLESRKVLKDTLVVITADHGEGLNEHDEETHAFFLYNTTVHAPLIFFHPATLPEPARKIGSVSLVDIAPTLLSLFGMPVPNEMHGRDLSEVLHGKEGSDAPVYVETIYPQEAYGWTSLAGLIEGGWKYIRAPREELYNLEKDFRETENLWSREKKKGKQLSDNFDSFLNAISSKAEPASSKRTMTPADVEVLKSLGYVFGGDSASPEGAGLDPKDMIHIFGKLANVNIKHSQKRFEETEEDILWVLDRQPDNLKARCSLGRVYEETGRSDAALREYQGVLDKDPAYVEALVGMGYHYLRREEYSKAIAFYEKAINSRTDPTQNVSAYLQLAACHERTGALLKAIEVLEDAVQVSPYASQTYNNLGSLHMRMNHMKEAEKNFKKALVLHPHNPVVKNNLQRLYSQSEKRRAGADNSS